MRGIYDDLRSFLSSVLHTSLKISNDLQYAMLTGIQCIMKENVFLDLNNLLIRTVKDKEYTEYFGFKKAEVEQILHAYDYEYNTEIQSMWALPAQGVMDTIWEELLSTIPGLLSIMLTGEN